MTANTLIFFLRIVFVASLSFAVVAAFLVVGSLAPETIGQVVNPHSASGAKGLTFVFGIHVVVICALVVSLPPVLLALVRNPTARSPGRSATAAVGILVFAVLVVLLSPALRGSA